MKKFAALLGATIAIAAPSAYAQSASTAWSGPYVGINVGFGTADVSTTDLDGWNAGSPPDSFSDNPHGPVGGLQAGYDWRLGSFVLGVAAEADLTGIKAQAISSRSSDTESSVDLSSEVSLRARAGYVFGDNWLAYVTGGVGQANIKAIASDLSLSPGAGLTYGKSDDSQDMTLYGAGFEVQVSPTWTFGGEYVHFDVDSFKVHTYSSTSDDYFDFNIDPSYDVARLTLNRAF